MIWRGTHSCEHLFTINLNTPADRVESLAGCGLESATTTCLAKLGYEVEKSAILDSLLKLMPDWIGRNALNTQ